MRVVIADDHGILREAIQRLLQTAGVELVGCAGDGLNTVKICEALRPDVAVLDLSMPLLNGIDAAREIRRVSPRTKIILITMHADDFMVLAALRAGVSAYLLKSGPVSTIVQAIEAVMLDGVFLCPGISRTIIDSACRRGRKPPRATATPHARGDSAPRRGKT